MIISIVYCSFHFIKTKDLKGKSFWNYHNQATIRRNLFLYENDMTFYTIDIKLANQNSLSIGLCSPDL